MRCGVGGSRTVRCTAGVQEKEQSFHELRPHRNYVLYRIDRSYSTLQDRGDSYARRTELSNIARASHRTATEPGAPSVWVRARYMQRRVDSSSLAMMAKPRLEPQRYGKGEVVAGLNDQTLHIDMQLEPCIDRCTCGRVHIHDDQAGFVDNPDLPDLAIVEWAHIRSADNRYCQNGYTPSDGAGLCQILSFLFSTCSSMYCSTSCLARFLRRCL